MSDTTAPAKEQPEKAAVDGVAALTLTLSLSPDDFSSSQPQISRSLCRKAEEHNDQLTTVERLLFLSRRDMVGLALAYPESLTEAQQDDVLLRPPPDLLARDIKLLFGLESIAEVVRDYWAPDRTTSLSYPQACCIACDWWLPDTMRFHRIVDPWRKGAAGEAAVGVVRRMRPEEIAFEKAAKKRFITAPWEDTPETFHGTEEEAEEFCEKKREQHERDNARMRDTLDAQLKDKIKTTTKEDALAMQELRERMRVECARDAEEDALEAQREAAERKREEEEEEAESRKRKRQKKKKKAARKAARRGEAYHEEEEEDDEEEDSDDGWTVQGSLFPR